MIIGITGPSGGGKSEAARIITECFPDALNIDGDIFMYQAFWKKRDELSKLYGRDIVVNGKIDTKLTVTPDKVAECDKIIFPEITAGILDEINKSSDKKSGGGGYTSLIGSTSQN